MQQRKRKTSSGIYQYIVVLKCRAMHWVFVGVARARHNYVSFPQKFNFCCNSNVFVCFKSKPLNIVGVPEPHSTKI